DRFDQNEYRGQKPMNNMGIPVSRWIDGVLENKENIEQRDNIRAMFYWGHAVNSQTRGVEMKKAMEKLDMMVIVDPYPTVAAVMNDRTDGVYLLPATTQFETYGSVTASNRSIQWRDQVIQPLFDSKPDHEIMYLMSKKLGIADQVF
ncbi:molybdopterin-dependent oxidoreductase, partial [Vibrio parahaemolyticus]|nr:molybdopterin-dependent oxidoreductase [Vibrio parahaemolyticus]